MYILLWEREVDTEVERTGALALVLLLNVLSVLCPFDPASLHHLAHMGPLWRKTPRKGAGMVAAIPLS